MPSPASKNHLIKFAFLLALYLIINRQTSWAQAPSVPAQGSDSPVWKNTERKLKSRNRPLYVGFDVSMSSPYTRINSDIGVLKNLPVHYFGGMGGGVLATPRNKIRGGIGLYYSGGNQPYSFDLLTGNLTYQLYILRIREVKYHTVEPYVFAGISQMKNKLYGYYLDDQSAKRNYSGSELPYLGTINSSMLLAGTGAEYQLENETGNFIHFYAEVGYGAVVRSGRSNPAFSATSISNTLFISIGVSFGQFNGGD